MDATGMSVHTDGSGTARPEPECIYLISLSDILLNDEVQIIAPILGIL